MIICALKRILHKKKSISMKLLESQIPPFTAAALRMIFSKRPVPLDHYLQEAGPSGSSLARGWPLILTTTKRAWKMHFWDPLQCDKMCFESHCIKFQVKEGSKFLHLLLFRAEGPDPLHPLMVILTVKCTLFFYDFPKEIFVRSVFNSLTSFSPWPGATEQRGMKRALSQMEERDAWFYSSTPPLLMDRGML